MNIQETKHPLFAVTALSVVVASLLSAPRVRGQEVPPPQLPDLTQEIEEVIAVGRFQSAAEALVTERLTVPYSADFLGADVIARAGDPDIAQALRRVPGLTVVDGKFVYVRGLGERYSSVTVNRAAVPSPELTRSVIPLDLFPTSIVESIKIQKSPSPDQPANFGGGVIDIRTTSIPSEAVVSARIGLGSNNISDGSGLVIPSGGSPLPATILDAIGTYRGNISVANIVGELRRDNPLATINEAQTIHQGLMDSVDTDVAARRDSLDDDASIRVALGNSWDFGGGDWTFGALFNASQSGNYRNQNQFREGVGAPDRNFVNIERTIHEERTVGGLNLGIEYLSDHSFEFQSYLLQTDESEAAISRGFDQNNEFLNGDQKIEYFGRIEKRELSTSQISGNHAFVETAVLSDIMERMSLQDLTFEWFFSGSKATTDLPNQTTFQGNALLDTTTGQEISRQLIATTTSGQFSFLELEDNQSSWGGDFVLPIETNSAYVTLSAGWWGMKKDRDYRGYNVNLNSVGVQSDVLAGGPGDVLTPGNLTVENGFDLSLGTQFGTESYVAAQKVDAAYGMIDTDWNDWRFTIGARYENYQQAILPVDLLDYSGVSIRNLQTQLEDPNQRLSVQEDDIYGSLALTYNNSGWLGSDDFQIRASYGQSVVRPGLREIADVVYIDPELDVRVAGNPNLQTSPIDNFEVRGEFYYGSGDNFTVSLFYKDIESPIEQIRSAGSDDDVLLGFTNATSGEISGIEFELLKTLPAGFFLSGNLTLSDSEIALNPELATTLTNLTRRMSGHSEWVVNATLGYDSPSAMHSVYLNFNSFGERIFFAGTGGNDDAYEQPFDSLGVVYKFFPTDRLELMLRLDNILDESREFEQISRDGEIARVISQDVGASLSLSGSWSF